VVLEIGTSLGCEASADQDVVISTGPLAEFEYGNSCAGNPVSFTNLSGTNGGPALIGYLWDFGDPGSGTANSSNLSNPSHIYTATGTYTVTLYVTNAGGCQDTVYHSVLIHPIPAVDLPGRTPVWEALQILASVPQLPIFLQFRPLTGISETVRSILRYRLLYMFTTHTGNLYSCAEYS
jgi:hypothetical protein